MTFIRKATTNDIVAFKHVAQESIEERCKAHYSPEELVSLLMQYPERSLYEKWLNERVLIVAEKEGMVIGFAQYCPDNNSIEAVHVLPEHSCNGIGRKLLDEIETIACHQGASKIALGASLNAVGFYEKCGYLRKSDGIFSCNDGVQLAIVYFEKEI